LSTAFPLLGSPAAPPPRYGTDFYAYYLAGKALLSHGNPYTLILNGRPFLFIYSPASLPFYAAFALFQLELADQLWTITSVALFVIAIIALSLTLKGDRKYVFVALAILLSLTSYPLLVNLQLGENDLLLAGVGILSLVCVKLNHRFASAVLLSTATLLKGPPGLFLIYFVLFRKDLKYFAYFAVSTLAIIGASLLIVPIGLYSYWILNVLPTFPTTSSALAINLIDSTGMNIPNESVTGLLVLLHLNQFTPIVTGAAFVLLSLFAYRVGSKKLGSSRRALYGDAMFLMNVLCIILFGPRNAELYPYVWVILPLALLLSALLMEQVRIEYLALVGFAGFLLNYTLAPRFLYSPILFPVELIGGLILTISLIPIFIRPSLIFKKA